VSARLSTTSLPFLAVITAALTNGCDSQNAPGATVTVAASDSVGVTIVWNGEGRWSEAEAWKVPDKPQLTIGVLDGDAEYQFFDISAAARQSDGDLVVADAGSRAVRLYDRDGVFERTLGGPGSGPGEFEDPTQILVPADDSVFVWDDAAFRITKFDSNGAFVGVRDVSRSEIANAVAPPLYPATGVLLPGGGLLVRLIQKSKGLPATPRFRSSSGALRVSADLAQIETVMLFGDAEQVVVDSPWGPLAVTPALAMTASIAVQSSEARTCIGDQEGPQVMCFGPDGSRTAVRWRATPTAVAANDPDVVAWREAALDVYGQKLSPDEAHRLVSQIPVPTTRPEYSGILLDRDGNLWVTRGPSGSGESRVIEHLVFDPAGAFLGAVSMPPVRVLEIGPDHVLGVHQDELEVQYVQVFEIVKPAF